MDFKFLKWQLTRGSLLRHVVLRAFMLVLATIVLSVMQLSREVWVVEPIVPNNFGCSLNLVSNPDFNLTDFLNSPSGFTFPIFGRSRLSDGKIENLATTVFKELMEKNLLQSNARVLCVGDGSASAALALRHLGFFRTRAVEGHPYFSLLKRRFVYELDFEDNEFDFVYSGDLDRVSVPALLMMEMERVLRPGGTGAVLVGARNFYSGGMVRSAMPISSFLRSSDVVHLCGVGYLRLVIFKKRLQSFASFERFQLPADCPSFAKNKPFMPYLEPPGRGSGSEVSYLPNFMNISLRNKLVYINLGAGEFARASVAKMSAKYCSNHHAAFDVFIIDHKTSVLSSYVTDPGITFVYDPALAGDAASPEISTEEYLSAPAEEEGFDFVRWFNATISDGDFVVLMMNSKLVELNVLVELFRTGAICHVDELFLRCLDAADCKTASTCGDCMNLIESLRKSGMYVHMWLED